MKKVFMNILLIQKVLHIGNPQHLNLQIKKPSLTTERLISVDSTFSRIISFSSFGFVDWMANFVLKLIKIIHNVVKNWGVTILLISILIYSAMYPLTLKSMSS